LATVTDGAVRRPVADGGRPDQEVTVRQPNGVFQKKKGASMA
jgi:hypothetical protein